VRALLLIAAACASSGGVVAAPPSSTQDRPLFHTTERELADSEREQAPYIAQARVTLPAAKARFSRGLGKGFEFYVTVRLHDADQRIEQVFVQVDALEPDGVRGRLATRPMLLKERPQGERLHVPDAEIRDWTIIDPHGNEEGNLVGNFIDRYAPAEERCGVMVEDAPGKLASQVVPGWHVSGPDAAAAFVLPGDVTRKAVMVQCGRRSVVPYMADVRVLAAGLPLSLVAGQRVSVLEAVDGHLRLRMLDGEMTEVEAVGAQAFLDAAQIALAQAGK
jgi:hypothetical protein